VHTTQATNHDYIYFIMGIVTLAFVPIGTFQVARLRRRCKAGEADSRVLLQPKVDYNLSLRCIIVLIFASIPS